MDEANAAKISPARTALVFLAVLPWFIEAILVVYGFRLGAGAYDLLLPLIGLLLANALSFFFNLLNCIAYPTSLWFRILTCIQALPMLWAAWLALHYL